MAVHPDGPESQPDRPPWAPNNASCADSRELRDAVASKPNEEGDKAEVVQRLEAALEECRQQLARAEAMLMAATKQDNQPRQD